LKDFSGGIQGFELTIGKSPSHKEPENGNPGSFILHFGAISHIATFGQLYTDIYSVCRCHAVKPLKGIQQ
jgi:hypothetical protein